MKISKVIQKVDEWQPNVFDIEDKLDWCYECTCNILNECPVYGTKKVVIGKDGMIIPLPVGVKLCDVAELYVNGTRIPITNATDYNDYAFEKGDRVVMVYRRYPNRYEIVDGDVPDKIETVCDAPFESMYIDFVCAQMAFQQNDAVEFNKFIGAFNDKLSAYKAFYGSNAPASVVSCFKNWF